jgi:hypothetical protein
MSVQIRGGSSSDVADVNADSELAVALTADPAKAGYVKLATTGYGQPLVSTVDGHLVTSGGEQVMFYDQVDGAALNSNLWVTSATTMTIAQAGGLITLNNSSITTVSTNASISSVKQVPLYGNIPTIVHFGAIPNNAGQANAVMEMGFGFVSAGTAPTDGVFFRWTAAGEFVGVVNYGGVETTTAAMTAPVANEMHNFTILIDSGVVAFICGEQLQVLPFPASQPFPVSGARQPVFARVYNTASLPGVAPRLQVGRVMVLQGVIDMERPWATTLASMGRGAYQSPVTTFAQLANHTNSAAPANATLSNTAAGYTTLGGKFAFAAVAGAVTDYALFGFQVPVGYQLVVTGVSVSTAVTGAAIATTPTLMEWAIGLNASAVSLATADGTNTWAPRRIPLGMQGFPLTAPTGPVGPGDVVPDLVRDFTSPLVVDSGRFFHVILTVPVGTATASQVFRGAVHVNGYFE